MDLLTLTLLALTFDWSINLGSVLTALSFLVGIWLASLTLTRRLTTFEGTVTIHTDALAQHVRWMEKQDNLLLQLVGDVQRLIGRLDAQTERRREPREPG